MAKKIVRSCGSGSNGQSVNYCESIIAELRGPDIPKQAKTKEDFMRESGATASRVKTILLREVASGNLIMDYKVINGHKTAFYWTAK